MTRTERTIRRVVDDLKPWRDKMAVELAIRDLERLLPPRVRRKARAPRAPARLAPTRKQAEKLGRPAVYAAVVERENGECSVSGAMRAIAGPCGGPLHIDHQWGRGKAPTTVENCRQLCTTHDRMKTENALANGSTSRLAWLRDFQFHCMKHGYMDEYRKAQSAMALEAAQHPGRLPSPDTEKEHA